MRSFSVTSTPDTERLRAKLHLAVVTDQLSVDRGALGVRVESSRGGTEIVSKPSFIMN